MEDDEEFEAAGESILPNMVEQEVFERHQHFK